MPRYTVRGTKKTVELNDRNFIAQGGEGSIYVIGDIVYKICHAGAMIPEQKFQELSVLKHPSIVQPIDMVLDSHKSLVGYTMALVPGNAMPLAQILTKTYREREGVKPQQMADLAKQMAEAIRFIHKHPGYLQVDGNEFNYMITNNHKDVFLIDVNSFQTPSFPADAIMPSIRDWSVHGDSMTGFYKWSPLSDWYSFSIISFLMFTGAHPYKQRHPDFQNIKTAMTDQMQAGVSILDPKSQFPKAAVYSPFEDYIPGGKDGAYMQWYRAIFLDKKRTPAPDSFQAAIHVAAKIVEIIGSNNFDIKELSKFTDQVVGYLANQKKEVVVTTKNVYVNGHGKLRPEGKLRIGFTPSNVPIAFSLKDNKLLCENMESSVPVLNQMLPNQFAPEDIMSCEGRVYLRVDENVFEVECIEQKSKILPTLRFVAKVMPAATRFYQGVAVQDMFGARLVSVFPETGHHRLIKIPELEKVQITDAKYEGNVLMALVFDKEMGQYHRYIFRFTKDWQGYDTRKIEDVNSTGLNFTVLSNGIVVCMTEEEKIEIFSSQHGQTGVKSISDPAIRADMHLCHNEAQARFALDTKVFSISVKK